jgi:single-strand DNA-binding protein
MKISITAVGNLVADPELRFTAAGKAVANLVIACSERKFDKETNTWSDGNTVFVTCSVWGKMAENCAESLQKGMAVIAQGILRQHDFEDKQGAKQRRLELEVDAIGPNLGNAVAKVERIKRDTPVNQQDPWGLNLPTNASDEVPF